MIKEKKAALILAGAMLLGATSLTACNSKEKDDKEAMYISESSIDTKDIIVIDTYNPLVANIGIKERYLILYKIGASHDSGLDLANNLSVTYIFRDIKDAKYIGMLTEYEDNESLFVYGSMDMSEATRTLAVLKGSDRSWYGLLEDVLSSENLKSSYQLSELNELSDMLNRNYISQESTKSNMNDRLSYTLELN